MGSNSPWVTPGSGQVYGSPMSTGPEGPGYHGGSDEPSAAPSSGQGRGLMDRIRRLLRPGKSG